GLLAAFCAAQALAQVASGTLSGTVVDESSAVAPGTTVQAREQGTGFTRTVLTGAEGNYVIEGLPPGHYTVTAQKSGFRTTISEHVLLEVNQKARLDFKLYVGEERQSVTAEATVSPVQSEEASIGYVLGP